MATTAIRRASPPPRTPGTPKARPKVFDPWNMKGAKAAGRLVPNYSTLNKRKKEPVEIGCCESCRFRSGVAMCIAGHFGRPILCETCAELRREKIRANRMAFYLKAEARTVEDLD